MKNTVTTSLGPTTAPRARVFGGFPHAITRLVSSLFHIILLPSSWAPEQLLGLA